MDPTDGLDLGAFLDAVYDLCLRYGMRTSIGPPAIPLEGDYAHESGWVHQPTADHPDRQVLMRDRRHFGERYRRFAAQLLDVAERWGYAVDWMQGRMFFCCGCGDCRPGLHCYRFDAAIAAGFRATYDRQRLERQLARLGSES